MEIIYKIEKCFSTFFEKKVAKKLPKNILAQTIKGYDFCISHTLFSEVSFAYFSFQRKVSYLAKR